MASPTQLNVVIWQYVGSTPTLSTVVIPISPGLQALDSSTPGSKQSGYSAADQAIRAIFRANGFTDGSNWYPLACVQKITAS